MGLQHLLFPVADQYSDPNAWNSDEHFPIKLALALAAAALAPRAAAPRAQKRPSKQRKEGVLGEKCDAPETYSPDVLFPIPRTRGDACWAWRTGRFHSKVRMCGTVMSVVARPSRKAAARHRGAPDPVRVAERRGIQVPEALPEQPELQALRVDGRRARDDKTGRGVRRRLPRERAQRATMRGPASYERLDLRRRRL